jgi:hypothetical protein
MFLVGIVNHQIIALSLLPSQYRWQHAFMMGGRASFMNEDLFYLAWLDIQIETACLHHEDYFNMRACRATAPSLVVWFCNVSPCLVPANPWNLWRVRSAEQSGWTWCFVEDTVFVQHAKT